MEKGIRAEIIKKANEYLEKMRESDLYLGDCGTELGVSYFNKFDLAAMYTLHGAADWSEDEPLEGLVINNNTFVPDIDSPYLELISSIIFHNMCVVEEVANKWIKEKYGESPDISFLDEMIQDFLVKNGPDVIE